MRIEKFSFGAYLEHIESSKVKNNKKIAFTLAEVLITLAIIGVVAALTIPTVIHKYQKRHLYSIY